MANDDTLRPDELRDMSNRVIGGAERLSAARARRGRIGAVTIGVVLVAGVTAVALSSQFWRAPEVAAPSPTASATSSPTRTPTPPPTPTPTSTPTLTPTQTPSPIPTPSQTETEPPSPPYAPADAQAELDAIGPDAAGDDPARNSERSARTDALAAYAAWQLGTKVALIRPTYVGLPDDQSDSPNSVLWWVVTSEPTGLPHSYVHTVDGMEWTGWGQGDRDLAALQARLSAFLASEYPGESWVVLTQGQ
ncbi:hypothetical protein [Microbacterium sp. ABRD28]|uniref:hypothetical protein n=1 Tax=Microbacterium sp. ABRD28 TaxID=2268461 RepID=UPI000F558483|nr:hypothetical protein [Microbacterium sp. ABRD28]AZC14947.1 hypothetical protein DT073_15560 [Microbacterium sp. ABRD28]